MVATDATPEQREEIIRSKHQVEQAAKEVKKNQQHAPEMNPPFFFFLTQNALRAEKI